MKRTIVSLLVCLLLCVTVYHPEALASTREKLAPLGMPDGNGEIEETTIDVPDVDPDSLTSKKVYDAMIAMKEDFPEGMHWTNNNYYEWYGGIFSGGYGCAGFAFLLSDAAFGKLPAKWIDEINYEDLRVGDILRVNGDTHSVIILEIEADGITIAEGNYNSSIHWGRWMPKATVEQSDYVLTRWPEYPESYKPEAPYLHGMINSKGKPSVDWGIVDGAEKYEVYRSETKKGDYKRVKTTKGFTFNNSKAKEGKTYYYKVRAVTKYGVKGKFSNIVKLKAKSAPAAPKVTGSFNSKGKPVLKWKKVSKAVRYQVYRSDSGKNGPYERIRTLTETKYTDKKAKSGKTYYYKVCAKSEYGLRSKYSKVVKMKVE